METGDRAGDTTSCGARRGRGEGGQGWYPSQQVAAVTKGRPPPLRGGERGPRVTPRIESSRQKQTDLPELYFGGKPECGNWYLKHRAAAWSQGVHTQAVRHQVYFNKMV